MNTSGEKSVHGGSPLLAGAEPSNGVIRHGADVVFLHGIARRMAAEAPFDDVLNEVVDFATSVVTCDSCFVYLLQRDALGMRAWKNSHPDEVGKLTVKLGQVITG